MVPADNNSTTDSVVSQDDVFDNLMEEKEKKDQEKLLMTLVKDQPKACPIPGCKEEITAKPALIRRHLLGRHDKQRNKDYGDIHGPFQGIYAVPQYDDLVKKMAEEKEAVVPEQNNGTTEFRVNIRSAASVAREVDKIPESRDLLELANDEWEALVEILKRINNLNEMLSAMGITPMLS